MQDPRDGSVSGDSEHGTIKTKVEVEPDPMEDELLGAVGGTDLNMTGASDLKWRPRDVLLKFNNENVTRPETPTASSTPAQPSTDVEMLSHPESPGTKKVCLRESMAAQLAKSVFPLALKPD